MSMKRTLLATMLVAGISMPLISLAGPGLTIINKTSKDSTSRINNNKKCSNEMFPNPEDGITRAGKPKTIEDIKIKMACSGHDSENCEAKVYTDDHCGTPVLTTIVLSTKNGIKTVTPENPPGYKITHSPWSIRIDEIR